MGYHNYHDQMDDHKKEVVVAHLPDDPSND